MLESVINRQLFENDWKVRSLLICSLHILSVSELLNYEVSWVKSLKFCARVLSWRRKRISVKSSVSN